MTKGIALIIAVVLSTLAGCATLTPEQIKEISDGRDACNKLHTMRAHAECVYRLEDKAYAMSGGTTSRTSQSTRNLTLGLGDDFDAGRLTAGQAILLIQENKLRERQVAAQEDANQQAANAEMMRMGLLMMQPRPYYQPQPPTTYHISPTYGPGMPGYYTIRGF